MIVEKKRKPGGLLDRSIATCSAGVCRQANQYENHQLNKTYLWGMDVSGFEQGAGGGSFEIAGITEAHHSRATEFKSDIERTRELEGLRGSLTGQSLNDLDSSIGQAYEDLENEILDYLEKYTNDAENFFNPDCPLDCEVKNRVKNGSFKK